MIILYAEQRSEAWFQMRAGRVTGTRFKSLVAKESTDTYKDLVTSIACEIITKRIDEGYTNAIMEEGLEKEPDARKEYEEIFGIEVRECGFVIPDEGHEFHELIGVSPDGLMDEGGLEIKCPMMKTHMGYLVSNKLPTEYVHQVQASLFVTGLKYWDFMSYHELMKPFVIRVEPDPALFSQYEERLRALAEDVELKLKKYKNYDYLNE